MLVVVAAVMTVVGAADAGVDWGAESFSAPVEVLRAATTTATPAGDDDDDGTRWLFRSVRWTVDAERRVRRVSRDIVRVGGKESVQDWSTVSLQYMPSREAPPVIRARVVTPDGRVFQLTPDMTHEDVPRDEELTISDARSVSAALPGVRSGAVVELELTWQTTGPLFLPAQAGRLVVGARPIDQVDVVLEHPRAVPLSVSFSHLALRRTDEDAGELHRVRLRGEKVAASGARVGRASWTTGASWPAVAKGYQALLEPLRASPVPVDVKALVAGAKTRREKAQRLLEWLHREVRYTGLEFGERSIVPWAPAEVLKRGFGDCKDLALLLVDVLAAAGVDARVALLDTEGTLDVQSPSLAFFDHAIVYVPAVKGEPATWVDATASNVPAGMLPARYAGEPALVIDTASTKPVPTWAPTSADSERAVELDVTLGEYGAARAVVGVRLTGLNAAWARDGIDHEGAKWMKVELESLGDLLGVPPLSPVREPSKRPAEPVAYAGEAARAPRFFTDWSEAVLKMPEYVVFDWLPDALTEAEPPDLPDGTLELRVPHVASVSLRVHPPPGFVLTEVPDAAETRLGPATLKLASARRDDGTVELSLRLDSGPRKYTKAEVDAFRAAYATWKKSRDAELRFVFEPDLLEKQGKVPELLTWYAKRRAEGRETPGIATRYAGKLLELGLADAARERSRQLVVKRHDDPLAWLVRGWVLSHDRFGNSLTAGFDRPGALAALRKAHELEPDCSYCLQQVSWLERYDDDGAWLSPKVDAARAAEAFRAAWPKDRSTSRWVELMVFAEDWAALREALTAPSNAEQRAAILLADQMVEGADAAWKRWSNRLERDELAKAVDTVLYKHLMRGRLTEAIALARTAGETKQLADLERLADLVARPPKLSPELTAMRDYVAALLDPDDAARERFAKTRMLAVPGGRAPADVAQDMSRGVRAVMARTGMPAELVLAGISLAAPRPEAVGPDRRLELKSAGASGAMYLVRHDARWRVLAVSSSRDLAAWALQVFDEKRAADGRNWAAWARALFEKEPAGVDAPYVRVVFSAWPTDDRLAAAALAAHLPGARRVLSAALPGAPVKARGALLHLLLLGAEKERALDEAGRWMAQLEADEPGVPDTFNARAYERTLSGDTDGREAALLAWLAAFPGAEIPLRDLPYVAAKRGDFALATSRWREVFRRGLGQPNDYNSAAWEALFSEGASPEVMEWAKKAGERKDAPWAVRHTLAVVLASDAKDVARTLEVFRGLASVEPKDDAWLVPARLAHRLGLREEARALYRRLARESNNPESSEALATKWLAELEQEDAAAKKGR